MTTKKNTIALIAQGLKSNEGRLLEIANVVGVGAGEKIKGGLPLGRLCVKVYVEKKYPQAKLSRKDIIPQSISAIETDVEEVGKIVALGFTGRYRPALGGSSIGHYKITAGTFGCLVKNNATGKTLILSNNHVLANSNNAKIGDAILQPGPYDGGRKNKNLIGYLERWQEIKFNKEANFVDAALARPKDAKSVQPQILEIGIPKGAAKAKLGMLIQKSGRTTGHTIGKIKDISATVKVNYDDSVAIFRNQILTSNISQGGDSGSLVLDMKAKAVGLLFAGSEVVTIVNPISEVLKALDIDLFYPKPASSSKFQPNKLDRLHK